MRALKIFVVAALLIVGPVILESCCYIPGSCCGGTGSPPRYDIDGMSMLLLPYPATSTTVPTPAVFSAVDFVVSLDVTYVQLIGSFGTSLLACDPAPPKASQTIAAVTIKSNTMLETTTGNSPAGNELNSFFVVSNWGTSGRPIADLIDEPYLADTFTFRSEAVLTKLQTHTFTFLITLSDGREFTLVTPSIELN